MTRYLSPAWLADVQRTAAASGALRAASVANSLRVNEHITGIPHGDITYHVIVEDGRVDVGPGLATCADVTFTQDHETAIAVASGGLNAQMAFMSGRLHVSGNMESLVAGAPVLVALQDVFDEVRSRTEFA